MALAIFQESLFQLPTCLSSALNSLLIVRILILFILRNCGPPMLTPTLYISAMIILFFSPSLSRMQASSTAGVDYSTAVTAHYGYYTRKRLPVLLELMFHLRDSFESTKVSFLRIAPSCSNCVDEPGVSPSSRSHWIPTDDRDRVHEEFLKRMKTNKLALRQQPGSYCMTALVFIRPLSYTGMQIIHKL